MSEVDIQVAVMVGDLADVKKYIAKGGDLEIRDEDGATPLFHAAFWTHDEIAKALLQGGARVNAQRNDGFTPLHVAARNNQPRMTKILVQGGADLKAKEDFGDTPLHWAYRSRADECIKILLEQGADTHVRNAEGKTPREVEGTAVERQDDEDDAPNDSVFDEQGATAGADASTVVGEVGQRDKSPIRPQENRSCRETSSPRKCRGNINTSGSGNNTVSDEGPPRAGFQVAYPPIISAGEQWHKFHTYMFEPLATSSIRKAHNAMLNGRAYNHQEMVDDCDRAIPPGTEVVIRPSFPKTCCVNPVQSTVKWVKDYHVVPFEVRPPPTASSGKIMGSIDFYVGPVLLAHVQVEMEIKLDSARGAASENRDILGPITLVRRC
ncbi:unnamed protein product [Discosporangium mesarthrocarpum]